jgi:uncharacterized protein (UPF0276 family)
MTDVYKYLDELQARGVTNMFNAGRYLQREFGMDKHEAKEVFFNWMRTKRDEK